MQTITLTNDPITAKRLIHEHWETPNGCTVKFTKKDGSDRVMNVRLDPGSIAAKYDDATSEKNGTNARRETNKARGNMVVTEWVAAVQMFQVRTIPLDKVYEISFDD